MTIEEFNNTAFHSGMLVIYGGTKYPLISVDFIECLVGFDLNQDSENTLYWVRCENCEIIEISK